MFVNIANKKKQDGGSPHLHYLALCQFYYIIYIFYITIIVARFSFLYENIHISIKYEISNDIIRFNHTRRIYLSTTIR